MITEDEKYMARCIELARGGLGNTYPNPLVGAVIVHQGKIIGEGFHRKVGESHAEVNAIASVKNKSLLEDSTLYVNLEPCSHHGRTPPCAELIIRNKIPRVVIGCLDPYPEVSGRGVRMLLRAGVEVITGVLEREARRLNKVFMTFYEKQRPYIILKWAQSADGFIDKKRDDYTIPAEMLSSQETQQRVHRLRSEVAAIMVGTHTALLDNPSLSVRYWSGKSPVRVVLDRYLRIPSHYHLLDGNISTIVFADRECPANGNIRYVKIDFSQSVLPQIMKYLCENCIVSLLVEGGGILLNSFLENSLWDEIHMETSPVILNDGVKAPLLSLSPVPPVLSDVLKVGDNDLSRVIMTYTAGLL